MLPFDLEAFFSQKEMIKWSLDHPDAAPVISELESAMSGNKRESIVSIMENAWGRGFHRLVYIAVTEDTNNTVIVAAAETIAKYSRAKESAEALLTALERADWLRHVGMEGQGRISNHTKQALEKSLCQVIGLKLETSLNKRVPFDFLKTKVGAYNAEVTQETGLHTPSALSPLSASPLSSPARSSGSGGSSARETGTGQVGWLVPFSLIFLTTALIVIWKQAARRTK
jgi:hypothetical protein